VVAGPLAPDALRVDVEAVPDRVEPGFPTGSEVHEVVARVRPSSTGGTLSRAVLCLHGPGASASDDAAGGAQPDCDGAVNDPRHALLVSWDVEDGVAVAGRHGHRDAGSEVVAVDDGWLVRFRFTVSPVTAAGPDWVATLTVEDASGATATAHAGGIEVAWFRVRIAPRERADHGSVEPGGATQGVTTHGGTFLANGPAMLVLRATPFASARDVLALAGGSPGDAPAWRTVALDCALGPAQDFALHLDHLVRVGGDWTPVGLALEGGTTERPVALATSCRLRYGGGALHTGAPYANEVEVDLVPVGP
jgi:hypothetical protein